MKVVNGSHGVHATLICGVHKHVVDIGPEPSAKVIDNRVSIVCADEAQSTGAELGISKFGRPDDPGVIEVVLGNLTYDEPTDHPAGTELDERRGDAVNEGDATRRERA